MSIHSKNSSEVVPEIRTPKTGETPKYASDEEKQAFSTRESEEGNLGSLENNEKQDESGKGDVIRLQPNASRGMLMRSSESDASFLSTSSRQSESFIDQHSGYESNVNECTEFCIDVITCFGLFDACCPSTGQGFVADVATFCSVVLVGLIHC